MKIFYKLKILLNKLLKTNNLIILGISLILVFYILLVTTVVMTINKNTDNSLKLLATTNYYKIHCLKPAVELNETEFKRCKKLDRIINKEALSFNFPVECDEFDAELITALKKTESGHNPDAHGDNGKSYGLMQVQYRTAKELGYKGSPKGLFDPKTNMKYGCMYLSKMLEEKGDIYRALDAYNRGPSAENNRPYKGKWTKHRYVGKILAYYKKTN